jgi:hypothetical protein
MKKIVSSAVLCLFILCSSAKPQEARLLETVVTPNCEEYLARMDNYLAISAKFPNADIYFFLYEGKEAQWKNAGYTFVFPTFGSASARIHSMKRFISLRNWPIDRFKFVKVIVRNSNLKCGSYRKVPNLRRRHQR